MFSNNCKNPEKYITFLFSFKPHSMTLFRSRFFLHLYFNLRILVIRHLNLELLEKQVRQLLACSSQRPQFSVRQTVGEGHILNVKRPCLFVYPV